jgi:hypothetical protein
MSSKRGSWTEVCKLHAKAVDNASRGYAPVHQVLKTMREFARTTCLEAVEKKGKDMELNVKCMIVADTFIRSMDEWRQQYIPEDWF